MSARSHPPAPPRGGAAKWSRLPGASAWTESTSSRGEPARGPPS